MQMNAKFAPDQACYNHYFGKSALETKPPTIDNTYSLASAKALISQVSKCATNATNFQNHWALQIISETRNTVILDGNGFHNTI